MKSTITLGIALAVGTLGMGTAAHADILAGGPTDGSGQTEVACRIFNAGAGPVTVTSRQIFRQPGTSGGSVPLTFDNCGVLAAGGTCAIVAPAPAFTAHACKLVFSPSGADVRGVLETRDNGGLNVFSVVELR